MLNATHDFVHLHINHIQAYTSATAVRSKWLHQIQAAMQWIQAYGYSLSSASSKGGA